MFSKLSCSHGFTRNGIISDVTIVSIESALKLFFDGGQKLGDVSVFHNA